MVFVTAVLLGVLSGCGGGIVAERTHGYDSMIDDGWEYYNQSRYDEAYRLFSDAKKIDDERPEGYIGCGWTLLRRQHPDSAVVAFRSGFNYIESLEDSIDVLCGLSGSYLACGENTGVINLFKQHPVSSYDNAFPLKKHDFFLDKSDLSLVQAMAFYRLKLYSSTENSDPDNAAYHVNQALLAPYEYTDPENLMKKITEYLEQSRGDYY